MNHKYQEAANAIRTSLIPNSRAINEVLTGLFGEDHDIQIGITPQGVHVFADEGQEVQLSEQKRFILAQSKYFGMIVKAQPELGENVIWIITSDGAGILTPAEDGAPHVDTTEGFRAALSMFTRELLCQRALDILEKIKNPTMGKEPMGPRGASILDN